MKVSTYKDSNFLEKYEQQLQARQSICFRKVLELIKPVKGKHVVDLGCGPGNLSKKMADMGANVVGVEKSEKWIELCKKQHGESHSLHFVTSDAGHIPFVKTNSIDVVVMNLVLPNVGSLKEVTNIFKEVGRVLKTGGVFIFSDLHPILIMASKVKPDRYQKYSSDFSYFKDGTGFTSGIVLNDKKGDKIEFHNKHWTLETYAKLLQKFGLSIYTLAEPTYRQGDPKKLLRYEIPEYILFGCKKVATRK